jgi:hypothetical protein
MTDAMQYLGRRICSWIAGCSTRAGDICRAAHSTSTRHVTYGIASNFVAQRRRVAAQGYLVSILAWASSIVGRCAGFTHDLLCKLAGVIKPVNKQTTNLEVFLAIHRSLLVLYLVLRKEQSLIVASPISASSASAE